MFCDYLIAYVTSKLAEIDRIENNEKLATFAPRISRIQPCEHKTVRKQWKFPQEGDKKSIFHFSMCRIGKIQWQKLRKDLPKVS